MIVSFNHKGLRNFFETGTKSGINPEHSAKLRRILDRLHAAEEIKDMNFPGSRLHLLEPKQDQVWSVSVSGNWRVTFRELRLDLIKAKLLTSIISIIIDPLLYLVVYLLSIYH